MGEAVEAECATEGGDVRLVKDRRPAGFLRKPRAGAAGSDLGESRFGRPSLLVFADQALCLLLWGLPAPLCATGQPDGPGRTGRRIVMKQNT